MNNNAKGDREKVAYGIDTFCKAHDIGRSKVYQEIAAGRLKAIKCGSRTLITAEAAKAWLESLPQIGRLP